MNRWTHTDLIGGHAALDFLNTVSDVGKSRLKTRLETWQDYLSWLAATKVARFEAANAHRINQSASLTAIHDLRETSYSVFHDLAASNRPKRAILEKLQAYISDAMQHAKLDVVAGGLQWMLQKKDQNSDLHQLVFLIDDLLRSGDLHRLRECGRCTWLFLDRGRGSGRRWCDMRKCGNRAKSESFRSKRSTRLRCLND